MRLTSLRIGGIDRIALTLIRDSEITLDGGDRMGTARFLILSFPAEDAVVGVSAVGQFSLGNVITPGQLVEIEATTSTSGALFGEPVFGEPVFGADIDGEPFFSGTVTLVEPMMLRTRSVAGGGALFGDVLFGEEFAEGVLASGINLTRVECRDWNSLLDAAVIGQTTFVDQTDAEIIETLFSANLPTVDVTDVATTTVLSTFECKDESLRSIMTRLAERTGCEYHIDAEKMFHYFLPSTHVAAFGFSEDPDNITTFAADRSTLRYSLEWRTPANSITVIGDVDASNAMVREVVEDARSVATYGTFGRTVVDRQIKSAEEARLRGNVELQRSAYPQINGTITHRLDGLGIGELLPLSYPETIHIGGQYLIRRITMRWWNPITTLYEIEWGSYAPDLARTLRRLSEFATPSPVTPSAIPAPGSVTSTSLAATLQGIQVVDTLPTLPDAAYTDNALVLLTTNRKIYRRNGTAWTAEVPAVDLTGQITETQISDGAISTPKIQALAITANKLAANSVTAGKVAADAITAGTIATGAIRAVDAVFEVGAIQSADIGDAQITSAKIGTAQILSANIGNLQVDTIHIANSAVGSTQIQTNGVTNINISTGVSATKITVDDLTVGGSGHVGQIAVRDAGETLIGWIGKSGSTYGGWFQQLYVGGSGPGSAKIIANSSGSVSISLGDGEGVTVSAPATDREVFVNQNGVQVRSRSTTTNVASVFQDQILISTSAGGNIYMIHSSGQGALYIDNNRMIKSRVTGWSTMTGTATRTAYDTATATTQQVAERLKALIDDLHAGGGQHGLLSS